MEIKQKFKELDNYSIMEKTKGKWFDLILVNMLALIFTALGFFIPVISFAIAFIVMSYLQIGLYGYVLNTCRGKFVDFDSIFLPYKHLIKTLCIKIITISGIILWGLLLIVPGLIYGLNCAFCGFIFFEDPNLTIKDVFAKSKAMVYGHRITILLVALVGIVMLCAAASFGLGLNFLLGLAFSVPPAVTSLLIIIPILITLVVASAPLFQVFLARIYDEVLNSSKKTRKNISKTKKDVV